MREQDFLSHVAAHAGLDAAWTAPAVAAVLGVLGAKLSGSTRALLAAELPEPQAAALAGAPDADVAAAAGVRARDAREIVASVCHVLAETLSEDAARALRRELPADLAAFVEASPAVAPDAGAPRGDTLASGRPGSRHPVSEARPDRTQAGSVAADANPHAATKLSTSTGTTQEREHETMAEGRPGAARPLA